MCVLPLIALVDEGKLIHYQSGIRAVDVQERAVTQSSLRPIIPFPLTLRPRPSNTPSFSPHSVPSGHLAASVLPPGLPTLPQLRRHRGGHWP